jgi:L-ribulose-5-phosphate 3-epimerase
MIAEGVGAVEALPYLISLSQWSLHKRLLGRRLPAWRKALRFVRDILRNEEAPRGVEMNALDFPIVARREFDLSAIDYIGYFYAPHLRKASYMRELRARADGEGVRSLLVTCADEGPIGHLDAKRRNRIAGAHLKWMDMAAYLGCHSITVRAESTGTREEQAGRVTEGLRALAERAAPHGLNVLVENHFGFSSESTWIKDVMARADSANLGMLPDWGNFATDSDIYAEVAGMMPLARAVSAKCYDFDANGQEATIDFPRLIRIIKDANYCGYLGIEYEGHRLSDADGIKACKALLESLQSEAAAPARAIA